jgi:hypothetical protein
MIFIASLDPLQNASRVNLVVYGYEVFSTAILMRAMKFNIAIVAGFAPGVKLVIQLVRLKKPIIESDWVTYETYWWVSNCYCAAKYRSNAQSAICIMGCVIALITGDLQI